MNKLMSTVLSLTLLLFVSCGDDDSAQPDFLTPLVGTWEASVVTSTGCTDPDDNGQLTCTGVPCFVVTINSNGTYTVVNNVDQDSEAGTITVTATELTLCPTGDTDCTSNIYSLDGSELTINFTDEDSPGCLFTTVFTKQ